jgi:hypothetical protein
MPRSQYKKHCNSDEDHNLKQCYEKSYAAIICCPRDTREKYDSSLSDKSCPDFSDLCEDKPKKCCKKKDLCKKSTKKLSKKEDKLDDLKDDSKLSDDSEIPDFSNDSEKESKRKEDSESSESESKHGCGDKRCNGCFECKACKCRECSDYSARAVVHDLGSLSDSCPDLGKIDRDQKKKCCKLDDLCKDKSDNDDSSERSQNDNSSSDRSEKSYHRGCGDKRSGGKRCGGCRECNDYSARAVLHDLGSLTDDSCPDFGKIDHDQKKKCCKLDKLCKDKSKDKSNDKSKDKSKDKSTCPEKKDESGDKRYDGCFGGNVCSCRECSDYSARTVAHELGSLSDSCPDFSKIDRDQKKKCCKLEKLCKKDESVPQIESKPESKPTASSTSSSGKGKKFIVSFKPKAGHPWEEYNHGASSVHVNGKNGPVLHLYRGCSYFFCVEQNIKEGDEAPHSFVLTNSPSGGPNSSIIVEGFVPVSKGCVCFKVSKSTPRYFFYQDAKLEHAGGLVIVHDE